VSTPFEPFGLIEKGFGEGEIDAIESGGFALLSAPTKGQSRLRLDS
jgi:hypothetical protein